MAVRIALRHAPPLSVPRRCHLFLLHGSPSPRHSSDFPQLRERMLRRLLPYATDYMTPTQNRSLRLALAEFLPYAGEALKESAYQRDSSLGPTHHLVYFSNVPSGSLLLPDGTDSLHSPGYPFTRRMWAGGSIMFRQDIQADGSPYHCNERITDVKIKGKEEEEKIFVIVERAIFPGRYPGELKEAPRIVEERTLVFMRDNRSPGLVESSSKILKPTQKPELSHKMVPTRELLFRFSALTLNAHAIHLDKQFCREVEGHRNLLVHGPLTVVLMIEVLQTHLQTLADRRRLFLKEMPEIIVHVEYRNLAPLYAEEEMTICVKGREKEIGEGRISVWDVWIEGPDGGYAVKGTVKTAKKYQGRMARRFRKLGLKSVSEGETIPEEQVALQNSIKARHENVSSGEGSLKEDLSPEEKTEKETEGEAVEEMDGESAPYFQR